MTTNSTPRPVSDNSLALRIADISTSGVSETIVCPFAGRISEFRGVYSAAITGDNNTLTIRKNGTAAGTYSPVSTGTAAGSTFVSNFKIPVRRGDTLAVHTSGESTNTSICNMQLVISGVTA